MEAEDHLHVIQRAALNHRQRAGTQLFSRLEQQLQPPFFNSAFLQQLLRGGQHHRRVAVMAAGMAGAGNAVDHVPERIHVGAQCQHRARHAAVDLCHDAGGLVDAARDLNASLFQLAGDVGRGFNFLKPQLGDFMQKMVVIENSGHRFAPKQKNASRT